MLMGCLARKASFITFISEFHTMKIIGICGSLRQKSINHFALEAAGKAMPSGMSLEILSIKDVPLYNQDVQNAGFPTAVQTLAQAILQADGVLIASPEYNFSYSGVLKNAIDWWSRMDPAPFKHKPVAILSATGGPLGGARSQYDLRKVLSGGLEALVLQRPEIFIGMAQNKFGADGALNDEATVKMLETQMQAFQAWIQKLSPKA
jgi:chromate reductase, NAD(P)H dehydrogenase (quinone)